MKPRCLLLTTDTRHHRYLAGRISRRAELTVLLEEPSAASGGRGDERFEKRQAEYEQRFFADGVPDAYSNCKQLHRCRTMNDPEALALVQKERPQGLITFGTRKVRPELFRSAGWSCNVHRGILPKYRGLDSEYWASYFGDFSAIGTTLHRLEERLDTGAILSQRKLALQSGMEPHHLRYHTTLLAADLLEELLSSVGTGESPREIPQSEQEGRYYSAIPSLKRRVAFWRFNRHVRNLS